LALSGTRRFSSAAAADRNVAQFKANPWFEGEVLPALRERVRAIV
jgi:hypothetical protein